MCVYMSTEIDYCEINFKIFHNYFERIELFK